MKRFFKGLVVLMASFVAVAAGVMLYLRVSSMVAARVSPQPPWSVAAEMPTPRSEMPGAVLDGRVYVPGGLVVLGGTTDAFEAYDPALDAWEELAPLPVALHHPAVAAAGGRVFVLGGYRDITFQADVQGVWAYDPDTDSWAEVTQMPGPRAAHVAVAVDDLIYVIGGVGADPRALWAYDPERDEWLTGLAPLSQPREHLAAAVVEGRIYVAGGRWSGLGNLATLEVYDPAADSWTWAPDMPTARSGFTAAALAGRLHVTGGESLDTGETFASHEAYDPETNAWATLPPLPTARHGLASGVVEDRWYVIGGATAAGWQTIATLTNVVQVYTPE